MTQMDIERISNSCKGPREPLERKFGRGCFHVKNLSQQISYAEEWHAVAYDILGKCISIFG